MLKADGLPVADELTRVSRTNRQKPASARLIARPHAIPMPANLSWSTPDSER